MFPGPPPPEFSGPACRAMRGLFFRRIRSIARGMSTFYLVRHGDKTRADMMVGRMPGVHLTAKGRRQAQVVARYLQRAPIAHMFSSPLERAQETAAPVAKKKRLTVQLSPAFHEMDMGEWTGISRAKLSRLRTWKQFCQYHGGTSIPGGETLPEVQARVVSEMIRLREKYPDEGIAIFTHEDPIRLAVCHFIGAPIDVYEHITIALGSVTVLHLDTERAILERLGAIPFGSGPKDTT
jgi:broad specificity phosphatase PhoE